MMENETGHNADGMTDSPVNRVHLRTEQLRQRLRGIKPASGGEVKLTGTKKAPPAPDNDISSTFAACVESPSAVFEETEPETASEEIVFSDEKTAEDERAEPASERKKSRALKYTVRAAVCFLTLIAFCVYALASVCYTIVHGPSEAARDLAVQSAMQASATKWLPGLFMSDEQVKEIQNKAEVVVEDVISLAEYDKKPETEAGEPEDKWSASDNGVLYETVRRPTFQAYILLVRDPSRVFVGKSSEDYATATEGITIFTAAERFNALAAVNGGEFIDDGGRGTGASPLGLTYSGGKCVWDDGSRRTFIGFTAENRLVVGENITRAQADAMGMRDGVSFMRGNTLITSDGNSVTRYYSEGKTATSQRTAIGQTSDGTVILAVTDGRTASSLGASHNDMIDLMVSYGAVSAGMVDGGSSAVMFYRDYYKKLGIDESTLDKYQKKGLVNNYVAFTSPRRMPTFFVVSAE